MQRSLASTSGQALPKAATDSLPIILPNASYYGTLAAARSLGRQGLQILTADPSWWPVARYSRFTTRHLHCPSFEDTQTWIDWLVEFGSKGPRHVIYATSDAVSFALARYQSRLSSTFHLYQPPFSTILDILDKGRLLLRAQEVGVKTPDTWFPKSVQEAGEIAADVGGKLLIKPRSQLSQRILSKGHVVDADPRSVREVVAAYLHDAARDSEFGRVIPDALTPMLQRYHPEALEGVYALTGFRDQDGNMALRAARKTLQRPRRIGVGVCFEPAEVEPEIAEAAARLSAHVGYYGAFELEFIQVGSEWLLIDFNGRFYNQIGLDIARGLDLPRLAYEAAIGNHENCQRLLRGASVDHGMNVVFCNESERALMIWMQRLAGSISPEEARHWNRWPHDNIKRIVDTVRDEDDALPHYVDVLRRIMAAARHPRSFLRQYGSMN